MPTRFNRKVDNRARWCGDTDFKTRTIRVNKKKSRQQPDESYKGKKVSGKIINTIVHEEMHAHHPQMYERTVRKQTRKVLLRLSPKQKSKLYSKYSKRSNHK